MSVQELKEQLAALPRKEQDEVAAYLFQLRHKDDPEYRSDVTRRRADTNSGSWLSPDEFEKQLDRKG